MKKKVLGLQKLVLIKEAVTDLTSNEKAAIAGGTAVNCLPTQFATCPASCFPGCQSGTCESKPGTTQVGNCFCTA